MPVVLVHAPAEWGSAPLAAIADAVASALHLGAGDVVATLVPTGASAASGSPSAAAPWPVIAIHGSDRGDQRMEAARVDAAAALTGWAASTGVSLGGVWAEWVLPA